MRNLCIGLLLLSSVLTAGEKKTAPVPSLSLRGTWCTGDAGMLLTFSGTDSLSVESASDESMGGSGTYRHTDSTFSATLKNGDLVLSLRYRYRWKGTDTIEAKATMFTVDGDSIEYPKEWMSMERCGKK